MARRAPTVSMPEPKADVTPGYPNPPTQKIAGTSKTSGRRVATRALIRVRAGFAQRLRRRTMTSRGVMKPSTASTCREIPATLLVYPVERPSRPLQPPPLKNQNRNNINDVTALRPCCTFCYTPNHLKHNDKYVYISCVTEIEIDIHARRPARAHTRPRAPMRVPAGIDTHGALQRYNRYIFEFEGFSCKIAVTGRYRAGSSEEINRPADPRAAPHGPKSGP